MNTIVTMPQMNCLFGPVYAELVVATDMTHTEALNAINRLVYWFHDDEKVVALVLAARPNWKDSDTPKELPGMISSAILVKGYRDNYIDAKDFGKKQGKGISPPSDADLLLGLVAAGEFGLFFDQNKQTYISQKTAGGGTLNLNLSGGEAKTLLRSIFYARTKRGLSGSALETVISTLAAKARYEGSERPTFLRVAPHGNEMYVDLGHVDGKVVHITPAGWNVTYDCPVAFVRPIGMGKLPEPERGGSLDGLKSILNLEEDNWVSALAFLLSSLRPNGPYMCLIIKGEQGSGKSLLCVILKSILDPHSALKLRFPQNDEMMMIHALESHLLVYDNISGIKYDMSDLLCALATGAAVMLRALYTNSEPRIFTACRPFILNGITDSVQQPDLMERGIPMWLKPMSAGSRKTEEEIFAQFNMELPKVLGALYDCLAVALANHASTPTPRHIRMADSVRWMNAAEGATGLASGTFVKVLEQAQKELMVDRIMNDPLVINLFKVAEENKYDGTVGELYQHLSEMRQDMRDRSFPATPAHFSRLLDRLRPALMKAGLLVEIGGRTKKGRNIRISLAEEASNLPKAASASRPRHEF